MNTREGSTRNRSQGEGWRQRDARLCSGEPRRRTKSREVKEERRGGEEVGATVQHGHLGSQRTPQVETVGGQEVEGPASNKEHGRCTTGEGKKAREEKEPMARARGRGERGGSTAKVGKGMGAARNQTRHEFKFTAGEIHLAFFVCLFAFPDLLAIPAPHPSVVTFTHGPSHS